MGVINTARTERFMVDSGKYLIGYPNKSTKRTASVAVVPGLITAGSSANIAVTVTGAKVSRQHKVIMIPPTDLEAGLKAGPSKITSANTVTLTIYNTTGGSITGVSKNWTRIHVIKGSSR